MNMDFGSKIKDFCKRKFGSINAASEQLDIPRGTLSRYFANTMSPTLKFFIKISEAGCDMNWLFEKSDDSEKNSDKKGFYDKDKEIEKLRKRITELEKTLDLIMDAANKKSR